MTPTLKNMENKFIFIFLLKITVHITNTNYNLFHIKHSLKSIKMSHLLQKSSSLKKKEDLTIDPPGQNGSPSEKLLGRTTTPMDFSTVYSWEGLDEICLENIVIASLNQDILKKNFEIIINALKKHTMQIGRLAKQNSDWEDSFNELRDKNDRSEREIKELQDANDILKTEEKNISQEIDKLKVLLSSFESKIFLMYFKLRYFFVKLWYLFVRFLFGKIKENK